MDALRHYRVIGALALAMIALHLINTLSGASINALGLQPRALSGVPGIALAPLLHGSWGHLLGNLLPFCILSALVLRDGLRRYLAASAVIIAGSGVLVWLVGREAYHVGASGWVFGLWAFTLTQAWLHRSLTNLAAALFVVVFYGGMVFGVMPQQGVSFEFHIAGILAGILAANLYAKPRAGIQLES